MDKGGEMKTHILIMIVAVIGLFPFAAVAQTVYVVDLNGEGDFTFIQDCIDAATDGDTCQVNPGTYVEHIDFSGKNLSLISLAGPEETILEFTAVSFHGGESAEALLEGFTIRNAYSYYGAVYCYGSSPTIRNCMIKGNVGLAQCSWYYCVGGGGGISIFNGSPLIQNCTITENQSLYMGGGIHIDSGSPVIENCIISRNIGIMGGGGIYSGSGDRSLQDVRSAET